MVTFNPRFSSQARFGQQQQAVGQPAATLPSEAHDHVAFSSQPQQSAPQVQFGNDILQKVTGRRAFLGLVGLGALAAAGCAAASDKPEGSSGANAAGGASGTNGAKDPVQHAVEVLKAYGAKQHVIEKDGKQVSLDYRFPTTADIEAVRPRNGNTVDEEKEGPLRLKLRQEEIPAYMLWLLGYEDAGKPQPPRVHSATKDALPIQAVAGSPKPEFVAKVTRKLYWETLVHPANDYFRAISENAGLNNKLERAAVPVGELVPSATKTLGVNTMERNEVCYALFMLKMLLPPDKYSELVSNPKLAGKEDGHNGAMIQFYDFSKIKGNSTGDVPIGIVDAFRKSDRKFLVANPADAIEEGKLASNGIQGTKKLVVYVDPSRCDYKPAEVAIALLEGLQKASS